MSSYITYREYIHVWSTSMLVDSCFHTADWLTMPSFISFIPWLGSNRLRYDLLLPEIRRRAFSVSYLPQSSQLVSNICWAVDVASCFRNKPLCQAPPPSCYNAILWWRHIQNITVSEILSWTRYVTSKPWIYIDCSLQFWHQGIQIKLLLRDTVQHTSLR